MADYVTLRSTPSLDAADAIMAVYLVAIVATWTILQSAAAPVALEALDQAGNSSGLKWGYPSSSPLPVWLLHAARQVLGQGAWVHGFMGMLCFASALWFLWRMAREFTTEAKAGVAVLLAATILHWPTNASPYNAESIQAAFVAAMTWLFYRALRHQRFHSWLMLGLAAAAAMLTKSSSVILVIGFFCFMFSHRSLRDRRNLVGMTMATLVLLAIMAPHLFWLITTDTTEVIRPMGPSPADTPSSQATLKATSLLFPLWPLLPMLAVWCTWRLWEASSPTPKSDLSDYIPWSHALPPWDRSYLLWVGAIPVVALVAASMVGVPGLDGSTGTPFYLLWGLFLFWAIKGDELETLRRVASVAIPVQFAMVLWYGVG